MALNIKTSYWCHISAMLEKKSKIDKNKTDKDNELILKFDSIKYSKLQRNKHTRSKIQNQKKKKLHEFTSYTFLISILLDLGGYFCLKCEAVQKLLNYEKVRGVLGPQGYMQDTFLAELGEKLMCHLYRSLPKQYGSYLCWESLHR